MTTYQRQRQRRERRRRAIGVVTALIGIVALTLMTIMPAFADGSDSFEAYDMHATVHEGGEVDVDLRLTYEPGGEDAHGVYLTFPTRQRIDGDPDHYREISYTDITASSDTAPADVNIETEDDGIAVYVGDPDETISGSHEYRIQYQVTGVINPGAGENGEDELYWNVIGDDFELPFNEPTLTFDVPEQVTDVGCWLGGFGSTTECDGTPQSLDDVAGLTFSTPYLASGEGVTVALQFPSGTFTDAHPVLIPRATFTNTMGGWATAGIAALGGLIVSLLGWFGLKRLWRDERYAGLTPGVLPATGQVVGTEPAPASEEVAVQFTPPEGLTPADVGALMGGEYRADYLGASLIHMAVRGYVHVKAVKDEHDLDAWEISRVHEDTAGLSETETEIIETVFTSDQPVLLDKLSMPARSKLADLNKSSNEGLKKWFHTTKERAGYKVFGWGTILLVAGIIAAVVLALTIGMGMLGLIPMIAGVAIWFATPLAIRRKPEGHAYYMQAQGFKKYLETAEGDQLRFEAEEDIFSRYLPYAMVYGVAEKWIGTFERLYDAGEWNVVPTWYTGTMAGAYFFAGSGERSVFSSGMNSFNATAGLAAMTAATAGSSGESAFSSTSGGGIGGGGFSGGGIGGGGGGGW